MGRALTPRELLAKLVSFPTVSRESNLALIDWVEHYLAAFGVKAQRVSNADGSKASLYARIGPEVAGGIILSGHTDVVPVDGQAWSRDPFDVSEKDGKLFGRGTCDMKGFIALALAAVPMALERGARRPLMLALSHDEEVGCLGAPAMIDEMRLKLPAAEAVIVGEPSMMKVVTGHKGNIGFHVHVRGFEVHSSLLHKGVNAIMAGARLIDWANEQNAAHQARTPSAAAARFDPPFTTVHVGTISGGTAQNITARDCRFGLEFRCVPDESLSEWEAALRARAGKIATEMQAIRPETGIDIEKYFEVTPLHSEAGSAAEALARKLTGDNATHVVSYGTEAGQFQQRAYSVIICGPGDIAQAHQPDEFLSLDQLAAGEAFMRRLVAYLTE